MVPRYIVILSYDAVVKLQAHQRNKMPGNHLGLLLCEDASIREAAKSILQQTRQVPVLKLQNKIDTYVDRIRYIAYVHNYICVCVQLCTSYIEINT